jgi:hypothetical protein
MKTGVMVVVDGNFQSRCFHINGVKYGEDVRSNPTYNYTLSKINYIRNIFMSYIVFIMDNGI